MANQKRALADPLPADDMLHTHFGERFHKSDWGIDAIVDDCCLYRFYQPDSPCIGPYSLTNSLCKSSHRREFSMCVCRFERSIDCL